MEPNDELKIDEIYWLHAPKEAEAKTFIRLVFIATNWVLFYSIVFGLLAFAAIAHEESDRCVKVYQEYMSNYSGMVCFPNVINTTSSKNFTFSQNFSVNPPK